MTRPQRELIIGEYYLRKLFFYCGKAQSDIYDSNPPISQNNDDTRVSLLGYARMIIFAAYNDSTSLFNLEKNKPYQAYREIMNTKAFSDDDQFEAFSSYSVYNFIIRIYSILESGNKTFFNKPKFNDYIKRFDPKLVSGYEILRAFRNTIHNNGKYRPTDGLTFNRSINSYNVIINPGDAFTADIKLIYYCSKASIELFKQIALQDLKERPYLIAGDPQYKAY